MPAKPKTKRKRRPRRQPKAMQGTTPADLTIAQYREAWDLFQSGHGPRQIRRLIGLTGPQFAALYTVGLPSRGNRAAQPSFERRLSDELAAVATEAKDAGKAVSSRGVRVLSNAMENAESATIVVRAIMRLTAERVHAALAMPEDKRPHPDDLMPSEHMLKVLRVLRLYQDASRPALAYRLIYGDGVSINPATRAVLDIPNRGERLAGAGVAQLPAALAMLDEMMGEGTADRVSEEIAAEIAKWSHDQLAHFATTGEEPVPAEIVDTTARDA